MLSDYTEKQLQDELKSREAKKMIKPNQIEQLNDIDLRKVCEDYLTDHVEGIYDSDTRHWIFEAALEMVYGKDVWNWLRELRG